MANQTKMTRGNMAKQLNINAETLRYYETEKLIKKPKRLENNYRIYDNDDVERIKFILMAKEVGFNLSEIKELLSLSITTKSDRKKVRLLASDKSSLIKEKIAQLTKMKKTLDNLIMLCENNETALDCPILKCLYQK
ncbi:MAG: MerR family transcriptional regulator [Gammaproteobacteria bacterium]|nr:MerR family transcriptional regulator [Gammaproteobacteria bacterium]